MFVNFELLSTMSADSRVPKQLNHVLQHEKTIWTVLGMALREKVCEKAVVKVQTALALQKRAN